MSNFSEYFELLEIEPTYDVREIKRAYARKVSEIHPEENPKDWEQIHDAYMKLLNRPGVKTRSVSMQKTQPVTEQLKSEIKPKRSSSKPKKSELDKTLAGIVENSSEYAANRKLLEEMLRLLKKLPTTKAAFYGELAIDENVFHEIRKHHIKVI